MVFYLVIYSICYIFELMEQAPRDFQNGSKDPNKFHRKSISLIELFEMFPDQQTVENWFEEVRWGKVGKPACCPVCGSNIRIITTEERKPLPSCRRHFNVKTNTILHRSKIPSRKWVIAMFLWSTSLKGFSSMKPYRDLKNHSKKCLVYG